MRELEFTSKLTLKSKTAVVKEAEFSERVAIGMADDSIGGGFLHVSMLMNAPQPWEAHSRTEKKVEDDSNDSNPARK